MEEYLRYSLLALAVFILVLIFLEYWFRRRRLKMLEITKLMNVDMDFSPVSIPHPQNNFSDSACQFHLPSTDEVEVKEVKPEVVPFENNLLVINLFAKAGFNFASYDLLQAIAAAGMQFGDMNIFHYYMMKNTGRETLFSLASATKPGYFNLDKIGEFSCVGLTLFSDLSQASDSALVFEKMLETAESLAEDLHGELYSDKRVVWNDDIERQYRESASYYCLAIHQKN